MFSPAETSAQSQTSAAPASVRNPRRRQRDSHDSVSIKQPLRKRSKLSEETFAAPSRAEAEGANGANGDVNAHAKSSFRMPVREREKKAEVKGRRGGRLDTSAVLTKTAEYVVKGLSAFPERLKNGEIDDYRARLHPGVSQALALTRSQALIWDYTTSFASPLPRIFTLPQPYKHTEPLPFGSLVASSGSTEIGLVVVCASTGKITYWENAELADSVALFSQKQQGVEGSAGGMLSGETVVELIDAEHAGYLVRFSTGRIAHFTIRDTQGRPSITAQFLRGHDAQKGGIFGSIKKVWRDSWMRGDLVSVKTSASTHKGHMDAVAMTEKGHIFEWDVSWAGQQTFRRDFDAQRMLSDVLREDADIKMKSDEAFKVLDCAVLTEQLFKGDIAELGSELKDSLLVLVAIVNPNGSRYALVELLRADDTVAVGEVIIVQAYRAPPLMGSVENARLLVPEPGHTAFAIFPTTLIVSSITTGDSHRSRTAPRSYFQDVIHFKNTPNCDLITTVIDQSAGKNLTSSCLLFTKRNGIARITSEAPSSREGSHTSARTKIEQAIYFGHPDNNIFDLTRKPDYPFSKDDFEKAVLRVSHDILTSSSEYIPPVAQSSDEQLAFRAAALLNLTGFVNSNYPGISRTVKFQILWDAEKIAAARAVWRTHEAQLKNRSAEDRSILVEVVDFVNEKNNNNRPGQSDLRQWFVQDARSMEKILPWAYTTLHELFKSDTRDLEKILALCDEANEIGFSTLSTALKFRQDNAVLFGLGDESLVDGVLTKGYAGLSEIWTSRLSVVNAVRQLTDFARVLTLKVSERGEDNEDPERVEKVAKENSELVDITCRAHLERTKWLLSHEDEKSQAAGMKWKHEFENDIRPSMITSLAKLGQAGKGMALAEKFRDLSSLVELSLDELRYFDPESPENEELDEYQKGMAAEKFEGLKEQVLGYFRKFGSEWIEEFHGHQVKQEMFSELLDKKYGPRSALTIFLRADPRRAKLSWLNDVTVEQKLPNAEESLLEAATAQETNAWARNVELSLAKLTSLAVSSGQQPTDPKQRAMDAKIDRQLSLARLQTKLYNHIKHTTFSAMDQDSALGLVMETYGSPFVGRGALQPALGEMLKAGFGELLGHRVMSPELLIDVLTLIDRVPCEVAADDIADKEFLMALQVLDASGLAESNTVQHEELLRLIWKRCFVRDDWPTLNEQIGKLSDEDTRATLAETTLARTFKEGDILSVWGPNPRPSFQRVVPPAALLAYSRPSDLASRFSNEELANSIARDNVQDDDDLASSIEAGLETRWWGACKETGESEALRIADAKAEETQRLKAFADNIMEPGFKAIHQDTIGHINKFGPVEDEMNGYEEYEEYEDEGEYEDEQEYEGEDDVVHGVEGDDEYEEGENGMDEDGDVEMEG